MFKIMGFRAVLFSDLHYGHNVENKMGRKGINIHGEESKKLLPNLIEEWKKINADFIINIGDLAHARSEKEAEELYDEILPQFKEFNIYHLFGNHECDHLENRKIKSIFKQPSRLAFNEGRVKHILLDAERPRSTKVVNISRDSLRFLKQEVADCTLPIIVYCHYPITEKKGNLTYWHIDSPEKAFIEESKELRSIIEKTSVIAYISGHTHQQFNTVINGIQHFTLPAFAEDNKGKPTAQYVLMEYPPLKFTIKNLK